MSYCLNPSCPKPVNHPKAQKCQACGSELLLRKRYHLVKGLGKGGFGATFLAADISLPGKPLCVIKQLRPNTDNPNFLTMARELFEREAKTLGRVGNHPQIPRLLDYFEDRQQFYLVQEFVKGDNLQQEIKKQGVLDEPKARQVLKEVLVILRDIHAQKVIHRDIKPANIIRREIDNRLVVIDFGVVKNQVNTVASGNSDQTALTAFAVGTPGFAPPEQLAMRPVYASDVYALGVTCMYLMTGKAPKNMECDPITGEIDWFKNTKVSDRFAEILLKMLEVAVKTRYKTADEVLSDLDMEGHIDSLSESMMNFPSTGNNMNTSISGKTPVSNNRRTTVFQNPNTKVTGGNNPATRSSYGSRQQRVASPGKTSASKTTQFGNNTNEKPKPIKIETATLLSAYSNGRRDFGFKDISMQDLQKANLSGGNFRNSRSIKTNLQGANLELCDFSESDMRQSLLRNTNLSKAILNSTNLEGADLRGANLSNSQLRDAKLKGANLCGANLTGAQITPEQLEETKTNWTTIQPSGKRGFW